MLVLEGFKKPIVFATCPDCEGVVYQLPKQAAIKPCKFCGKERVFFYAIDEGVLNS